MKIVSYNLNGIRSATSKGLRDWINNSDVDIFCFQETRATDEQIRQSLYGVNYTIFSNVATKLGYSGTAILTKEKPIKQIDDWFLALSDIKEGRIIVLQFNSFFLIDLYVPHGNRLEFKLDFMQKFLNALQQHLKDETKPIIIATDFNIAHTALDLSNPKECAGITGFLPEERQVFDSYINLGLIDTYRIFNVNNFAFTWSSYRSKKNNNQTGYRYRFDYIFVSKSIKADVLSSNILLDVPYSDHYPVITEINNLQYIK